MKRTCITPFIIICALCIVTLGVRPVVVQAITVEVTANVIGCGDTIISGGEQCDGLNLGGSSCSALGFTSGTLSCTSACTFNTSQCVMSSGSSGGGSGGGDGSSGGSPSIPSTNVVFTGRAYPRSTITLLKDAQVAATTIADSNANFQMTLSGLSGGNYIFSVYSEDSKGLRSSLLTFPISVTSGVTTKVGNIFIAPTIAVDKSEVRRGDNIAIFGQSVPSSEITISVNSPQEFFIKRIADATGAYLLNFDTSVLDMGQHHTKSKASLQEEITAFGKVVAFRVGTQNIPANMELLSKKGDLNKDGKVNLVDFSIAAFWYKRELSVAFKSIEIEHLNGDGRIDLVDFSIMAFHWTG